VLVAAADLRSLLADPLPRYTEHTVVEVAALERELVEVRERGWASTVEEYELGLNALAAPVRDHDGRVVAAVSVSGPSYRFGPEVFDRVAPRLLQAADEISRRLGHLVRP
jgi:DNA-binding IclR family transcriptional regulator